MLEPAPANRERRRYRRYIVSGVVRYGTETTESAGSLLNLGWGGLLVRSRVVYTGGTNLTLLFQVEDYPETIHAKARVVGTQPGLMALRFLHPPDGIDLLLRWLEFGNAPWTNESQELESGEVPIHQERADPAPWKEKL
ncbi:MAG TPA: PilZ domain-containing protein [Terriglobia bacterium]|nr:PilZ domain-containing protein [Terriglobia bacterium]